MLAMTSPSHTKLWLHQTNNYSLMPCLAASQLANYQNQLIQQNQPIHVSPSLLDIYNPIDFSPLVLSL